MTDKTCQPASDAAPRPLSSNPNSDRDGGAGGDPVQRPSSFLLKP